MSYRVLKTHEPEFAKLKLVAQMLTYDSKNNAEYVVRNTFLDAGQNWSWTTICRDGYRECQVLSPRDWDDIMNSRSLEELLRCVRNIQNDEYFGDK